MTEGVKAPTITSLYPLNTTLQEVADPNVVKLLITFSEFVQYGDLRGEGVARRGRVQWIFSL